VLASGDPLAPPSEALRPAGIAYIVKPVLLEHLLATVTTGVAWSLEKTRVH
jgi:hypothetical protein